MKQLESFYTQLLNMFALMSLFNHPVNALQFCNECKHNMMENLLDNDEIATENLALYLTNEIFPKNGTSFWRMGPTGNYPRSENI